MIAKRTLANVNKRPSDLDIFAQEDLTALHVSKIRAESKRIYAFCLKVTVSKYFSNLIQLCILANTVVLSLDRYPIQENEKTVHEFFNYFFTFVFLFELFIKTLGLGIQTYWKEFYNKFDCIIVLASVVDLLVL